MKIIEQFEVPYFQYLDVDSNLASDAPDFAKDIESLKALYKLMVEVRIMDAKAIALQRTGKIGTYPSTRGQEAAFVGVGHAMNKEDIFVPYYRDVGTLMLRGVKMSDIFLYWGGDERGNIFNKECENFPYSVPVGSQPLLAAGAGFSVKYKKEKKAVVVSCGEGATSQGDFYEAMNVAGVWKLPVVFVVINNQWAISVPRERQTAAGTIAQKAIAAGFNGEQIDGNDIIAVEHRTKEALKRARENHEPTLLELVCYRQHDHTTADDASRYEPEGNREKEWKKEPISRLKKYLEAQNAWTQAEEDTLQQESAKAVDDAVQEYLKVEKQSPTAMFDYLYEKLPAAYQEQYDELKEMEAAAHG